MRVRQSLEYLQSIYDSGDRKPLETLVRAFKGIQELDPSDENSFWNIASYHGEPGNFCHHATVLFPTWHRAYMLRFEDALRSIEGCEDVTLPFWDETLAVQPYVGGAGAKSVPSVLTSPTFILDGEEIKNPLYSYKFQEGLAVGQKKRWSKDAGYDTVRYPLSGLVGDEKMQEETLTHNMAYSDEATNAEILSSNVKAWLQGTVKIDESGLGEGAEKYSADTYSAFSRFRICMNAPNYTVFSNTQSQAEWMKQMGYEPGSYYVASVESGHNAMHLAVGGFFQWDEELKYNANPIRGANGDMGANEVASYDPIFYFHHAFIDLVFWNWQRRNHRTMPGSLDVIEGFPGTKLKDQSLDMETELRPFTKADGSYYNSHDITSIDNQLGYTYGISSMDQFIHGGGLMGTAPVPEKLMSVEDINTADYSGSFVIRLYAENSRGKKFEIGREPILSRYNVLNCRNCVEHQVSNVYSISFPGSITSLSYTHINTCIHTYTHTLTRIYVAGDECVLTLFKKDITAIFPISPPHWRALKGTRRDDQVQYSVEVHGASGPMPLLRGGRQPTITTIR
jgi:tyrosinase